MMSRTYTLVILSAASLALTSCGEDSSSQSPYDIDDQDNSKAPAPEELGIDINKKPDVTEPSTYPTFCKKTIYPKDSALPSYIEENTFDEDGRLTKNKVISPIGTRLHENTYDSKGNLVKSTYTQQNETNTTIRTRTLELNENNRPIKCHVSSWTTDTAPSTSVKVYKYDTEGNLTTIDKYHQNIKNTDHQTYDQNTINTYPSYGTPSKGYIRQFNKNKKITKIIDNGHEIFETKYNDENLPIETKASFLHITYTYEDNKIVRITHHPSENTTSTNSMNIEYNESGEVKSYTLNNNKTNIYHNGNTVIQSDPYSITKYHYDANGNIQEIESEKSLVKYSYECFQSIPKIQKSYKSNSYRYTASFEHYKNGWCEDIRLYSNIFYPDEYWIPKSWRNKRHLMLLLSFALPGHY